MSNVLEVKDLSVILDSQEIIHNLSFSVGAGEALAIIGPNGAGKTVLFRSLLGLMPYQGEVHWKEGIRVGYVPQKFSVDRNIPVTVKEFFLLKSKKFWLPEKNFLNNLAHELKSVGLGQEIFNKNLSELSGGQLQRVLIAFALIDHPQVLLFDEPTSGIDIGFEETIYTLLHKLQKERGTTILLISHDIGIVYRYADKVLCLNKEMLCHGKPQEVLNPQELTAVYGEGAFYEHSHEGPHHKH